jgi:hypothetical protein
LRCEFGPWGPPPSSLRTGSRSSRLGKSVRFQKRPIGIYVPSREYARKDIACGSNALPILTPDAYRKIDAPHVRALCHAVRSASERQS